MCSPPPRTRAEQANCWRGIETGLFDLFSSDHCPFRYEDDRGRLNPRGATHFKHVPNGIPGVELRMPILFSEGVSTGRIDVERFVALTSTNHARTYGLYPRKGTIAIGSDADIAIWDPARRVTARRADLHDGSDYSPYEGLELTGWPVTVVLGGRIMVRGRRAGRRPRRRTVHGPGSIGAGVPGRGPVARVPIRGCARATNGPARPTRYTGAIQSPARSWIPSCRPAPPSGPAPV